MTNIDENYPQFINLDTDLKKKYLDLLSKEDISFFSPASKILTQLYFYAASIGFKKGMRIPSKKSEGLHLYNTLSETQKLIIRAIALKETDYDFDTLLKGKETLQIIEEYVNGGLPILWEMATNIQGHGIKENLYELLKMDE